MKCAEAPVRRATALSKCWFPLIHLFVVVYACLLQSHDCVSIATRVWVIICVTTFIPLRKGEGEVRLSSLSKEGAKGRRKDRQKGSGREAQAGKNRQKTTAVQGYVSPCSCLSCFIFSSPCQPLSVGEKLKDKNLFTATLFMLLSE